MDKVDLGELAERVEKLDGPDKRVGAEVEIALRGFPERAYAQRNSMRPRGSPELDRLEWAAEFFGAGPTGSLDSAMSLVPEGWAFGISSNLIGPGVVAGLQRKSPYAAADAEAATPALALTAAALRARLSTPNREVSDA